MDKKWIRGMDISSLPQLLQNGAEYYDFDGNRRDPLELIRENGVNYIRLRIWNDPENMPESGGFCGLPQTVAFAKKIKKMGFGFALDFHYSDWWADPGQQRKPKAWENLSFPALVQAVHDYTLRVLSELQKAGALPDMVQIGNEIRSGMLFPDGSVQHWDKLAVLINSGISAVREVAGGRKIQVMLHLDQGGRYHYFQEWFDEALRNGVTDFDCIGLSYYPFWHGGFQGLRQTMDRLALRYRRPLIVAETAYAWKVCENGVFTRQTEKIGGFPAAPDGQYSVLKLVQCILASVPENLGAGFFYWEPLTMPLPGESGGWSEDMGLFNHEGKPMEGLRAYRFDPFSYDKTAVAKVFPVSVSPQNPVLPSTVQTLTWDGVLSDRAVTWCSPVEKEVPKFAQGTVDGTEFTIPVESVGSNEGKLNLIQNGGFLEQWAGWELYRSSDAVSCEIRSEAEGENCVRIRSPENFQTEIFQQTNLLSGGRYDLTVEMRGENTTGVECFLFAESGEKKYRISAFLSDDYLRFRLPDIPVQGESLRVGVQISSPPIEIGIRHFCLSPSDG